MPHMKHVVVTLAAVALVAAAACGGSNTKPSQTASIGPTGGTLKAGSTTLVIAPNAMTTTQSVTLREAEPKHGGTQRVEIEPHGTPLQVPAKLSVTVNDTNVKLKLVDDSGNISNVEVEDRNHHSYKTTMSSLGEVEVEVEHGATCSPACTTGQECDDGVCKAHTEDSTKRSCDTICESGQECDDGTCKTHSEVETEHGSSGTPGACNPPCATGLECDTTDLVCKAHGGGSGH